MEKSILYVLEVTPKYTYDWDLYDRFHKGTETEYDKVALEKILDENRLQRELIRDIIKSESVVEPDIISSLNIYDSFFNTPDMAVCYRDCEISQKDQLSYLRYIGEELLPWVKEVRLKKREL